VKCSVQVVKRFDNGHPNPATNAICYALRPCNLSPDLWYLHFVIYSLSPVLYLLFSVFCHLSSGCPMLDAGCRR